MLTRTHLLLLIALAMVVAGCGGTTNRSGNPVGAGPAATTTTKLSGRVPPKPIPFSATNLDGFTAVVRNALPGPSSHLPYQLKFPTVARLPAAVFVSNPDALPVPMVIVQYPSKSPFGTFWIREDNPPGLDQAYIEDIAAHCISCTEHGLVQVTPGINGALLAGPEGPTSVTWLQNGLHFVVIGPPGSFTSKFALAVARATAAVQPKS